MPVSRPSFRRPPQPLELPAQQHRASSAVAAAAAAALPGAKIVQADAQCLQVALALKHITFSHSCSNGYYAGWQVERTAASVVPWLAISGRVLLYVAHRLQSIARQQGLAAANSSADHMATCQGVQLPAYGEASVQDEIATIGQTVLWSAELLQLLLKTSLFFCGNIYSLLGHTLSDMRWDTVSQRMSAAGYDVASLQQHLAEVLKLVPLLDSLHADCHQTASLTGEQIVALESLGASLTSSMAVPCACNNPACAQLEGPLELQLVNGRTCMCGGCRVAHYCCRFCQRQHWKQHKPVCHAIAAVQASAATVAATQQPLL